MLYKSPFKIDNSKNIYDQLKKTKGVILFGTGNLGNIVLAALKKAKINIICLTDNNKSRWRKIYIGINNEQHKFK
jgi:hypothetical protein